MWREYAGGYTDWLAQRPAPARARTDAPAPAAPAPPAPREANGSSSPTTSSANWRAAGRTEALETSRAALLARMSAADYHTPAAADEGRRRARPTKSSGC